MHPPPESPHLPYICNKLTNKNIGRIMCTVYFSNITYWFNFSRVGSSHADQPHVHVGVLYHALSSSNFIYLWPLNMHVALSSYLSFSSASSASLKSCSCKYWLISRTTSLSSMLPTGACRRYSYLYIYICTCRHVGGGRQHFWPLNLFLNESHDLVSKWTARLLKVLWPWASSAPKPPIS